MKRAELEVVGDDEEDGYCPESLDVRPERLPSGLLRCVRSPGLPRSLWSLRLPLAAPVQGG